MVRVMTRRYFTLMELIVVMAMVMLLCTMVMPGLIRAQSKAYRTSCSSNLRQLACGFQMYASDYRMRMPPYVISSKYLHGGTNWAWYIQPYYGDVGVLDCPASPQMEPETTHEALHLYDGNYGWNFDGTQANRGPISSFSKPSGCYLVFDSGDQCVIYGANNWENLMEELDLDWESGAEGANRHNGCMNVTYLDGHIEYLQLRDFLVAPCGSFQMPWNIEWQHGMLEAGTVPFPIR